MSDKEWAFRRYVWLMVSGQDAPVHDSQELDACWNKMDGKSRRVVGDVCAELNRLEDASLQKGDV